VNRERLIRELERDITGTAPNWASRHGSKSSRSAVPCQTVFADVVPDCKRQDDMLADHDSIELVGRIVRGTFAGGTLLLPPPSVPKLATQESEPLSLMFPDGIQELRWVARWVNASDRVDEPDPKEFLPHNPGCLLSWNVVGILKVRSVPRRLDQVCLSGRTFSRFDVAGVHGVVLARVSGLFGHGVDPSPAATRQGSGRTRCNEFGRVLRRVILGARLGCPQVPRHELFQGHVRETRHVADMSMNVPRDRYAEPAESLWKDTTLGACRSDGPFDCCNGWSLVHDSSFSLKWVFFQCFYSLRCSCKYFSCVLFLSCFFFYSCYWYLFCCL